MKKTVLFLLLVITNLSLFAQMISHNGSSNYTLVERTNLRQYLNGKYTGLVSREVRSFIFQEDYNGSKTDYTGDFYVAQDTVTNMRQVNDGIHEAIPSSFSIASNGQLTMKVDNGYPTFRSFPVFPDTNVTAGAQWKGTSYRAVDPLNNGIITKIPMTVLYTYVGQETYKGQDVYRINAEWATRYGISYWDWGGDRELKSAQGSHKAYILVEVDTGAMVFMTDNVDETFIYNDGTKVNYKGTLIQFTEYPVSVQHEDLLPALKRIGAVAMASKDSGENSETNMDMSLGKGAKTSGQKAAESGAQDILSEQDEKIAQASKMGQSGAESQTGQAGQTKQIAQSDSTDDYDFDDDAMWKKAVASAVMDTGSGSLAKSGTEGLLMSQEEAEREMAEALQKSPSKILVSETDSGLKLAIHDLKFKPDSDELMPGENGRLDEIASILKLAPSSMFLIEGHTAKTGYTKGEYEVSNARARRIAGELAKRGISAGRFICKGLGSTKPVASNSTKDGMAMNRRVEITILE